MKVVYYILGLAFTTIILFQSCHKEDAQETEAVVVRDSVTVNSRNGTVSPIYYITSNSLSLSQKYHQQAFNKDSIVNQNFKRTVGSLSDTYTKKLGTLDPSYQNKPARKYDITITFKDTTIYLPSVWIKDTSAVEFNKIGSINLFNGKNKVLKIDKINGTMNYYDTNYKVFKDKYLYNVKIDKKEYDDFITATNTGYNFWLNHKI